MLKFALAVIASLALSGSFARAEAPGAHGCPHCALAGADLSNQCLQNSDFQGADLSSARLVLTCLSHSNLRKASLRRADLSGANLLGANLDAADFAGAILSSTSLKGARMAKAKGLTQAQLDVACGDAKTRLPAGLTVKACK